VLLKKKDVTIPFYFNEHAFSALGLWAKPTLRVSVPGEKFLNGPFFLDGGIRGDVFVAKPARRNETSVQLFGDTA
jgi:hypothetical protein